MPSMANIVLNDSTSPTPVAHTFNPMSLRNDVGSYMDKSGGSIKTRANITIGVRPASSSNQGHKVTARLTLPHVITPAEGECCVLVDAVVPFSYVNIEFLHHNVASDKDISDLLAYLGQFVQDAQFVDTVKGESLR